MTQPSCQTRSCVFRFTIDPSKRPNLCPTPVSETCIGPSPSLGLSSRLLQVWCRSLRHGSVLGFDIRSPQGGADWKCVSLSSHLATVRVLQNDVPAFVKEKKIPAKGIISRSVATVPKLCHWVQQSVEACCVPSEREMPVARLRGGGGFQELTRCMGQHVPAAKLTSGRNSTSSIENTMAVISLVRCPKCVLQCQHTLSWTLLPLVRPEHWLVMCQHSYWKSANHEPWRAMNTAVPKTGMKFSGRYIKYRTRALGLKRSNGLLTILPSLAIGSLPDLSSLPSVTRLVAFLETNVPSKVSSRASWRIQDREIMETTVELSLRTRSTVEKTAIGPSTKTRRAS